MLDVDQRCVDLLVALIGHRTPNPGGDEPALAEHLAELLRARGADDVSVVRVPRRVGMLQETGAYVYARYGTPRFLLNVHLDTVPVNTGWSRDPFEAAVDDERVTGLGASDTKGAITAALIALEHVTPRDVGILFSGDEERTGTCLRRFLASDAARGLERALVCEPTARRAGVRHRGISSYRASVRGKGGHSSGADHMPKPIVTMARLALALDELGRRYLDEGPEDMRGICMNVAGLDGGVAFNVVPDAASLTWSTRAYPGFDATRFAEQLVACIGQAGDGIQLETTLDNPPFATHDDRWVRHLVGDHVADLGPLQFWTEAAALAQAGVDAVVVGPGDIAQAHAADEFVTRADLVWAVGLFIHVLSHATA